MTSSISSHSFDTSGRYTIPGYDKQRPFSSFLPGIAGPWGVPMWAFYVNRGQGIASFGIESKENPILEFQPANKAYHLTPTLGFRTFLKLQRQGKKTFYEPFAPWSPGHPQRTMHIGTNDLELTESVESSQRGVSTGFGLNTQVLYFILPGEPFGGLVRQLTIRNTGKQPLDIELLDGLPALIPYGVDNGALKHVSRTIEAWMQVEHYQRGMPFYRLKASAADSAEVSSIVAGNFALGTSEHKKAIEQLPVLIDPNLVFGHDTSLHTPAAFLEHSLHDLLEKSQADSGKTPCAFFGVEKTINQGNALKLTTVYGHVNGIENLQREAPHLRDPRYLVAKHKEAQQLTQNLTKTVYTQTSSPRFDAYIRQTFLDNILRGGWPVLLGDEQNPHPYHIYSRKHGDLERDYNHFFLAAEFYSQGNGNFRDVCQNRRCDVLLEPRLKEHNIHTFLSLIQLDGYNPLVVQGTRFTLPSEQVAKISTLTDTPAKLEQVLKERFSPGGLLKYIADHKIGLKVSYEEFIKRTLRHAIPHLEAEYGEGFWVDHWTYILDLIENFLAVYPDRKATLLFGNAAIPFYQSQAQVRPRSERYVLTKQGARQYNALKHIGEAGWAHTSDGEIYHTNIFGKLILLAGTKFGTLDPEGMGIEMEAGKPGWYDALNGLPGLFGSSMNETYELLRLVRFLRESLGEFGKDIPIMLPVEFGRYLQGLATLSRLGASHFHWWEQANQLRESYREQIYQPFLSGEEMTLSSVEVDGILQTFEHRLREGIARAQTLAANNVPPTYFRYTVTEHEPLSEDKRPTIRAKAFQTLALPPFLEGAVRAMKVANKAQAEQIYKAIKNSALFDQKLKMYKVNAPLKDEPYEIGRARAFTPGWLENESIWLHMAYKYLLEVLKAGLYEEFFDDFKNCLVPFQPPERYGRSLLENSSFLVSSAHPDQTLHGTGFVARLSGATAEFLEMWTLMMAGAQPFQVQAGELILRLHPILPSWLFDEQDQVQFNFLGHIPVTYHNPQRVNTWNAQPQQITLQLTQGNSFNIHDAYIPAPYAAMVRERVVKSMIIRI